MSAHETRPLFDVVMGTIVPTLQTGGGEPQRDALIAARETATHGCPSCGRPHPSPAYDPAEFRFCGCGRIFAPWESVELR